jgi:glyoxylase-like metal-dependent hydrolase (beta-lactamase superfamily II)
MIARCIALVVAGLAICGPASAHDANGIEVKKLSDHLYELSRMTADGYPEKSVASVGPDGLLVVDTGSAEGAPALLEALKALGHGMPRFVVNTHSHIEHIAGNPVIAQGAVIVGHQNLRERYLHGLYSIGNFPSGSLPTLTFTDTLSLQFNGEEIRLAWFGGAHDDSDIAVWFTRSKVAVVGALCMGNHIPSIDGDTSDIRKYPDVTARLLAWLPDDVRLVPGHADDCDMAQGRRFLEMLRRTGEIVRAGVAAHQSLAQMQAADVLKEFASWESSYTTRADWLWCWYEALTVPNPGKPRPFRPVLDAYANKGAAAAVAVYRALRRTQRRDYWFEDRMLAWVGRRLINKWKRDSDGRVFLESCIQDYPDSEGAAISHSVLAAVLERQGDVPAARAHLAAYLERHGEDGAARKKLAELDAAMKRKGVGPSQG